VQDSTIIGLEHHTPDNIVEEIESAVSYQTDFHQFMLYTPVPGTPLYEAMAGQGRLLADVDFSDMHGQYKFDFQHEEMNRRSRSLFLGRLTQTSAFVSQRCATHGLGPRACRSISTDFSTRRMNVLGSFIPHFT